MREQDDQAPNVVTAPEVHESVDVPHAVEEPPTAIPEPLDQGTEDYSLSQIIQTDAVILQLMMMTAFRIHTVT